MIDEIFDYFGGNSTRKLEPLDESEMFEDLMPEKQSEPPAESEASDVGTGSALQSDPVAEEVDHETTESKVTIDDSSSDDESNWDSLASTLGLPQAPVAVSKKSDSGKAKTVKKKQEPIRNSKGSSVGSSDRKDSKRKDSKHVGQPKKEGLSTGVEEFSGFDMEGEADEKSSTEVLSEMFVPVDDADYDSPVVDSETSGNIEDDPFAAFHHSSGTVENQPTEAAEPEHLEKDSSEESEDDLVIDDDYIEFAVKDLDRNQGGSRQPRSKRRRRNTESDSETSRRPERSQRDESAANEGESERTQSRSRRSNRGSRDDSQRDESASNEGESERTQTRSRRSNRGSRDDSQRDESASNEGESERTQTRSRRSNRGSRDDSQRDESVANEGESERTQTRSRRSNRGSRDDSQQNTQEDRGDRESGGETNRESEQSDREQSDRKKPKIPTWDDAICGVIEQNIKRHKSNTGRGGKRRRR